MNLFRQLTEKPWMPGGLADLRHGGTFALPTAALGLRVFLAIVTILFFLLIVAYADRMEFEDWRPAPRPWLLWLNTTLLVLGSIAMQWARIAVRRGEIDGVRIGLMAGGAFTAAFLVGQIMAWRQLDLMVGFNITNPAIGFFYLITALHGLHLLGGLAAWGRTTAELRRGVALAKLRLSVELCAIYWHYLLLVWVVLFGLLFSGNDNLGILLGIVGFR